MRAPLPLHFVSIMLVLGVAIEALGFGVVAWLPKLPLALLLLLALFRLRPSRGRA